MARFASITMSMRNIGCLKTIQAIMEGNLKASTATKRLQFIKHQVNRLVQLNILDSPALATISCECHSAVQVQFLQGLNIQCGLRKARASDS